MRQCNMLKNWGFCFLNKHGNLNRMIIADSFDLFLGQKSSNRLRVPGRCILKGIIYKGNEALEGKEIHTEEIRYIDRVNRELEQKLQCQPETASPQHNLYRATTTNGSEFFFYSDDHADELYQMIECI